MAFIVLRAPPVSLTVEYAFFGLLPAARVCGQKHCTYSSSEGDRHTHTHTHTHTHKVSRNTTSKLAHLDTERHALGSLWEVDVERLGVGKTAVLERVVVHHVASLLGEDGTVTTLLGDGPCVALADDLERFT